MGTFRDDMLEVLDECRGIPGDLGMRLFTVSVVKRTHQGSRPGIGLTSDTTSPILVALGSFNAKVRNVTSTDAIASGGLYTVQDVKVGPFTPPFLGSNADGSAVSVFDPPPVTNGTSVELFYKIVGPGYSAGGDWFKKIGSDTSAPLHYTLTLRKTGKVA